LSETTRTPISETKPEWSFGDVDYDDELSGAGQNQTDYRAIDEGMTSLGATDTNADEAEFSDFSGGVRSTNYDAESEAERVGADFDSWSLENPSPETRNDAPGIHPENMTTAGAQGNRERISTDSLGGDNRDAKRSGNFSNDAAYHTDLDTGTPLGG
jgi:hypothetical protein